MGELEPETDSANVNVTLDSTQTVLGDLYDSEFPCPLCAAGLLIRLSKRQKPYCTCNSCGIQIFFRGQSGISRLRRIVREGLLVSAKEDSVSHGIALLNRLERLKLQKRELETRRGIVFSDPDVENAVDLVDAEIETVQGELAKLAQKKQKEAKK